MPGTKTSGNHRTDYKRGRKPKAPELKAGPDTRKQISLRLDMDLFHQLHILALKSRRTVNEVMTELIAAAVNDAKTKGGLQP